MTIIYFLLRLMPFFWNKDKNIRLMIVLSLGFGLIAVALNLCIPISLRYIVNFLSSHFGSTLTLSTFFIIASYGFIWTLAQISLTIRSLFLFKPMQRTSRKVTMAFFRHLLSLPLHFHLERKTGSLLGNIEQTYISISSLINILIWQIIPLTLEILLAIAITCWIYGIIYGAMVSITLVLYIISTFFTTNQTIKYHAIRLEKKREVTSYLHEALHNYETIKYSNNDNYELLQCDHVLATREETSVKTDIRIFLITLLQMMIIGIGLICITCYASFDIFNQHLKIGDFVLLNGYILQFSLPLSYFGYVVQEMKQSFISIQSTLDILKIHPDICDIQNASSLSMESSNIVFNAVNFSYDKKRNILNDISFEVPQGKTIAIVGPTGSGKSTISKLIYRFFDTESGSILINNQDIKSVTLDSLRKIIGIVPQDTVLFNNTLKFNIAYGNRSASEDEILQAIKLAGLTSFIEKLSDGLNTIVGERGLKISGGEKQRVAIARMLLKKPKIYIFDEATSSLDVEMEQQIKKNIEMISKDKTTIIISHRLSTVTHADEIIVLYHGRILEKGTHQNLIAHRGYYFEMFQKQFSAQLDHTET